MDTVKLTIDNRAIEVPKEQLFLRPHKALVSISLPFAILNWMAWMFITDLVDAVFAW